MLLHSFFYPPFGMVSPGAEAGVRYRAIADLAGSGNIQAADLAETLQYRPKLMLG